MPRMMEVYDVGEEVLIKATITAVVPDRDRFNYELTVTGETDKLKHRFQHKDLTPIEPEVAPEQPEEKTETE